MPTVRLTSQGDTWTVPALVTEIMVTWRSYRWFLSRGGSNVNLPGFSGGFSGLSFGRDTGPNTYTVEPGDVVTLSLSLGSDAFVEITWPDPVKADYIAGFPSLSAEGESRSQDVPLTAGEPSLTVQGRETWSAAAAGDTFTIPAGANAIRVDSRQVSWRLNRGATRVYNVGLAASAGTVYDVRPGDVLTIRNFRASGMFRIAWYVRPEAVEYAAGVPSLGANFLQRAGAVAYTAGAPSLVAAARAGVPPIRFHAGAPSMRALGRVVISGIGFAAGSPSLAATGESVSQRIGFAAGFPVMDPFGRVRFPAVPFTAGTPSFIPFGYAGSGVTFTGGIPSLAAVVREIENTAPRRVRAERESGGIRVNWFPSPGRPTAYEWTIDGEVTWTTTGRDVLTVFIPAEPGRYRLAVRPVYGTMPGRSSPVIQITLTGTAILASTDLLIGQWRNSPRLQAVINIGIESFRDRVEAPRQRLQAMGRIDEAEGVWLDNLGRRYGLMRPWTSEGNIGDDPRFGFDSAGVGFDQAPFRGEAENDAVFPLPDGLYREFIKARIVLDLSDGSIMDFGKAVNLIDPNAGFRDNHNMTVTVFTHLRWVFELAQAAEAIPLTAGVRMIIQDRGRFGFDDAGVGFDQGPFG